MEPILADSTLAVRDLHPVRTTITPSNNTVIRLDITPPTSLKKTTCLLFKFLWLKKRVQLSFFDRHGAPWLVQRLLKQIVTRRRQDGQKPGQSTLQKLVYGALAGSQYGIAFFQEHFFREKHDGEY
jgi:hypothetical protein